MKILSILLLLFSIKSFSQRRNYFPISDRIPNCNLIDHGNFARDDKKTLKIKFRKNKMIEIWGDRKIIIESSLKMSDKCTFETEIKKIKTQLTSQDNLHYVGRKTKYEIVETGKKYIVLEYTCNEDRNTCTEILDKVK